MGAAAPFVLSDVDGGLHRLDEWTAGGATLLAFVERDCPTSAGALRGLAAAGGRVLVISEGTVAAARSLEGAGRLPVLVETAPYPVSAAYGLQTVPTLVLVGADGVEAGRVEGWDRRQAGELVARVGGDAAGLEAAGLADLKPGCQARNTLPDHQALEAADAALAADDGIEQMWRRGWTDGLPTVPPTPARVSAMLNGFDGGISLGQVPPKMGELTLERLAACAVLAGCEPSYFPLVRTIAEAALDPAFNLHGMQNTTHFAGPVVIVNGPVRRELGMNAGMNVLGFGNRANATIGRSLRLVMALTGGGTPGGLDRSALGGPHKLTLCFPENEEVSPWQGLHTDRGFSAQDSVVTLFSGESPAGVSDHYSQTADELAATLAQSLGNNFSPNWFPVGTESVLVLCPEHATTFAEAGWTKQQLQERLAEKAVRTAGSLRASGSGDLGWLLSPDDPDDKILPKFRHPDEIMIVVAGGPAGRFSATIAQWNGRSECSTPVLRKLVTD